MPELYKTVVHSYVCDYHKANPHAGPYPNGCMCSTSFQAVLKTPQELLAEAIHAKQAEKAKCTDAQYEKICNELVALTLRMRDLMEASNAKSE